MVLWEGIPLKNPAMGLTDLSLLQSGLFQNIRLTSGGSPALWGSGNVGGVLQLESEKPRFSQIPETGGFIGLGGGSAKRAKNILGRACLRQPCRLFV